MKILKVYNPNNLPTIDYKKFIDFQGDLKHPIEPEKLTKLKSSLIKHGVFVPKFVWFDESKNANILDGHQTKKAIASLEDEGYEIPEIPYVEVLANDRKDAAEKLLQINSHYAVMNPETTWFDDLNYEPGELVNLFESIEIPELTVDFEFDKNNDEGGLCEEDAVPEVPEEARTKRGDIYELPAKCGGWHRVMCGDSTVAADVERLMNGEKAVLLHADPPYGMGKENEGIENDNLYREKLDAFQMKWWRMFRPYFENNSSAYIWGQAEDLWRLWYVGGLKKSERLTFRSQIIWDKPPSASSYGSPIGSEKMRSYPHGYETVLFFMLGEQGFNNNADNYWDGWNKIVDYLETQRQAMKWGIKDTKRIAGHSEKSGCHWFDKSQWMFPTEDVYNSWKKAAKGVAFKREYDELKREYDELKREYDELKREYDELKREFYETRAYFDNTHENMTDVWDFKRVHGEERYDHATPKPVIMLVRAIKSSCKEQDLIAEPFLGSGTTLIAAEKTNRRCYGMEIDEHYCDVIVQRYVDFTGNQNIKLNGKDIIWNDN